MLKCVLVSAACVGSGRDGFDPDYSCSGPISVLKSSRNVDAWYDGTCAKGVCACACVMYCIFAGVHHGDNECVDVLDQDDVVRVTMCEPFSKLYGGGVNEFESNGSGTVGTSVSFCLFSGADSSINVLLGGVAFHFRASNGVGPASDDALK